MHRRFMCFCLVAMGCCVSRCCAAQEGGGGSEIDVSESVETAPEDAQECMQRFISLRDLLRRNWGVYGQASMVESHALSPGEMRSEWFQGWVMKDGKSFRYRECVRVYGGVNLFSSETMDRVLHVDGKHRFFSQSLRPMRRVAPIPERNKDGEPLLLKDLFNVGMFPAVNVMAAIALPGSLALQPGDKDPYLEAAFFESGRCTHSKVNGLGDIVGTWSTLHKKKSGAWRITFSKKSGYAPTLVEGFYLDERLEVDEEVEDAAAKASLEVSIQWRPIPNPHSKQRKFIYVPHRVTNNTLRINRMTTDGSELEILAVWKPLEFDEIEIVIDEPRGVVTQNGFTATREELAKRFLKEHEAIE